jgi:hypothetical protein
MGEYQFIEAQDYSKFLQLKGSLPNIAMAIMDIECPSYSDGVKLILNLRIFSKDLPILITTKLAELGQQITGKYNISEVITKPLNMSRFRLLVSKALHINKEFMYEISDLNPVYSSFEFFLSREISISERYKKKFSMLLITLTEQVEADKTSDMKLSIIKNEILALIKDKKGVKIRNSDILFSSSKGDIAVILPFTDADAALNVKNRLKSAFEKYFSSAGIRMNEVLYMVTLTYPDDGKDIASMMESAYNRLESKEILEKLSSILHKNHRSSSWKYLPYVK